MIECLHSLCARFRSYIAHALIPIWALLAMATKLSKADMELSKVMTTVLRHEAVNLGLPLRPDGYVPVAELLELQEEELVASADRPGSSAPEEALEEDLPLRVLRMHLSLTIVLVDSMPRALRLGLQGQHPYL